MGGREERRQYPEREEWITEVSDTRLSRYGALLETPGIAHRLNGERRPEGGEYFRDLVERERSRRGGSS